MRITEVVSASQMASILLAVKELEVTPEPFRRQGRVMLLINFSEYCQFISTYLDKLDWLATSTAELLQYIESDDTASLFRAFLKDIAVACMAELYFSELDDYPATAIVHTVNDAPRLDMDTLNMTYDYVGAPNSSSLINYMKQKGYQFKKVISAKNHPVWKYACICWATSMNVNTEPWNIDYATFFPEYI